MSLRNMSYQNRTGLWTIIVIGMAGAALALFATDQTIRIHETGLPRVSICNVNAWINCKTAQASSHAMLFGIPVAWWGFLYYGWVILILIWTVYKKEEDYAAFAVAFILSLPVFCYTIYKAYILFFILGVLCPVCVAMYMINASMILVLKKHLNIRFNETLSFVKNYIRLVFGKPSPSNFAPHGAIYFMSVLTVFGLGSGALKYLEPRIYKLPHIDITAAVSEHFKQPVHTINSNPSTPVWGNPDNPVKIYVFSDFQCPACRLAAFHLKTILLDYDYVSLFFLNYPLTRHEHAGLAARAGIYAQQSGDFWTFHDELFNNQDNLDRSVILSMAERHGWNLEKFTSFIDSNESYERVRLDIELGNRLNVDGTPAVFINGRKIKDWRMWLIPDILREIVREEYRRVRAVKPD